ncbi:MAG TPA: hypothetical protein VN653_02825, partial [Anaerolineales bacterium]|nr:hypothetical protein [Anaerolineales bacterium]
SVAPSWYCALRSLLTYAGIDVGAAVAEGSGVRVASATGTAVGKDEAELHPNRKMRRITRRRLLTCTGVRRKCRRSKRTPQ